MGVKYPPRPGSEPTGRELQVLWAKAQGLTYQQTATRLDLNPLTIKTHLSRLSKRLGSHDTAHSVAICFRRGIFPPAQRIALTDAEQNRARRKRTW